MAGFREAKARVREILSSPDWRERLGELLKMSHKQVVGALFGLLLPKAEGGEELKWRAVTGFGPVVAAMAGERMEDARVIMRQMIWRMNEESGNIGWGIPEAMAEIMANHDKLADEYNRILVSYIHDYGDRICDDNYLDHPPLRWGVLWGIGRLAERRPDLMAKAEGDLLEVLDPEKAMEGKEYTYEGLSCHDARARALACYALGVLESDRAASALKRAGADTSTTEIFRDGRLFSTTVGEQARGALERINREG